METKQKTEGNQAKSSIRKHYRSLRSAQSAEWAKAHSDQICMHILQWAVYQNAHQILFYYPLEREVSLLPVIYHSLSHGKKLAFPKVSGESMSFYEITDLSALQEGCFHVMEPIIKSGQKPVEWDNALCFVPGVAFDRQGGRLGYGKGYYDRYIQTKNELILAGCAYELQIDKKLPVDSHDKPVHFLISEAGIQKLSE